MKKTKLYDQVKSLLEKYPELRDSDKKLMWAIWYIEGLVVDGYITKQAFYSAISTESVRRARQKVMELNPHLKSSKRIQQEKDKIEKQRGTHIFRTPINPVQQPLI